MSWLSFLSFGTILDEKIRRTYYETIIKSLKLTDTFLKLLNAHFEVLVAHSSWKRLDKKKSVFAVNNIFNKLIITCPGFPIFPVLPRCKEKNEKSTVIQFVGWSLSYLQVALSWNKLSKYKVLSYWALRSLIPFLWWKKKIEKNIQVMVIKNSNSKALFYY